MYLKKLAKKYDVTAKANLEETVTNMMGNITFLRAIPPMISAAKSGIQVGHMQNKPEMVKFNALVISYLEAIQSKDTPNAIKTAKDLIKAGHGEVFGLK